MESKQKVTDMTVGSPWKEIVVFTFPLLMSNVMQQLYVMTDTIIVGRGVGVEALAAIGTTDMLRSFSTWGLMGLSDGFGVIITMLVGAGRKKDIQESAHAAMMLTIPIGLLFVILAFTAVSPLLHLINVPENIFADARIYLFIMYFGAFGTLLYGTSAAILRAYGNSRTPFVGMLISSVLNVIMDLIFVFPLHWGIAGAGAATVIAQIISGLYCLKAVNGVLPEKLSWRIEKEDRNWYGKLLAKGMPVAFQNSFIAVGGVIFQSVINGFGVNFVAGFTAVSKLYLILEGAALALKGTMTSYVGQNIGAGKVQRVREGVRSTLLLSLLISGVIAVLLILFGKNILMLFISSDPATEQQILSIAYHFLFNMCVMMYVLYLLDVYRGTVMGLGNTVMTMFSGVGELAGRLTVGFALTPVMGAEALYYAEPTAWICGAVFVIAAHYVILHRYETGRAPIMQ